MREHGELEDGDEEEGLEADEAESESDDDSDESASDSDEENEVERTLGEDFMDTAEEGKPVRSGRANGRGKRKRGEGGGADGDGDGDEAHGAFSLSYGSARGSVRGASVIPEVGERARGEGRGGAPGRRWTAESWDNDDGAHMPRRRRRLTGGGPCAPRASSSR